MTTHPAHPLAELNGSLMCMDIDDVQVDDVMLIPIVLARVCTRPKDRTHGDNRIWQGICLPEPTDETTAREDIQTRIGTRCLILRPISVPDAPQLQRRVLPDGELRIWSPAAFSSALGNAYVLDVLGVELSLRERDDGLSLHIDTLQADSDPTEHPTLIVEVNNSGALHLGDD